MPCKLSGEEGGEASALAGAAAGHVPCKRHTPAAPGLLLLLPLILLCGERLQRLPLPPIPLLLLLLLLLLLQLLLLLATPAWKDAMPPNTPMNCGCPSRRCSRSTQSSS